MGRLTDLRYRAARWTFRRFPGARRALEKATDAVVRSVVGPQVVIPPPAFTHDPADLLRRTDSFNQASEVYFARYPNPDFILNKPFSEPGEFPRYLFNLGVLFQWLRLAPGDVVLELGAGTCWLSHFLNRYGCATISVDVSQTALELGRKLFASDPRTRWDLEPQFLTYGGRRLPLPDDCCDRVVLHDAFHHVPNPEEVLRELVRVLRPGGIVGMAEPGRRHSLTADSQREMEETGVLENDIVIEQLAGLAAEVGFSRTTVVPLSLPGSVEVDAVDLHAFLKGKGFHRYWTTHALHLLAMHYIFLYKGDFVPTTRRPSTAAAAITLEGVSISQVHHLKAGERLQLSARLENRGDTLWLPESAGDPGRTRLGAHLFDHTGARLEHDWFRARLDEAVRPGAVIEIFFELPPLPGPGRFSIVFDLVAEGVLWFAQKGSETVNLEVEVSPN